MDLYSYTCPECEAYTKRVKGVRVRENIQVRCPSCGFVERIPQLVNDLARRVRP